MNPLEAWKQLGYRILEIERATQNVDDIALRINKALVDDVRLMVEDRFGSEGPGWAPLRPKTIAQRAKLGFGPGPILQRTGLLRQAAREGVATLTSDSITLTLKDGAAPTYIGAGQARRRRIDRPGARLIDLNRRAGLSTAFMHSGRISDYAERLNAARPFYGAPTSAELAKIVEARNDWIERVVMAIDSGQSLDSIGLPR